MKILVTGGSGLVGHGMRAVQHDDYFACHDFTFVAFPLQKKALCGHGRIVVFNDFYDFV